MAFVAGIPVLSSGGGIVCWKTCGRRPAPARRARHVRRGSGAGGARALFGRRRNGEGQQQGFALSDAEEYRFDELEGVMSVVRQKLAAPGAYAVRDSAGVLQYVGYARNVAERLSAHRAAVPHLCVTFQTYVPALAVDEVTADLLEGVLEYWVGEAGGMPPGNTVERAQWEAFATPPATATATDARAQAQSASASARAPQARYAETNADVDVDVEQIPVRERRTARRRSSRGDAATAGVEDTQTVDVEVDPLDPFTATRHARTTRERWQGVGERDADREDWIPIVGVVGVATLIWLLSVLGGALPSAAPSVGL